MRFFYLFVFMVLMYVSWSKVHTPGKVPTEIHYTIQNELEKIITEHIKTKLPNVAKLTFHHLWTELNSKGNIVASFEYSFENWEGGDEITKTQLEGKAILTPNAQNEERGQTWTLASVEINNENVEFKRGMTIHLEE